MRRFIHLVLVMVSLLAIAAVGVVGPASTSTSAVRKWDLVASPRPRADSELSAVSCVATNWCVAVGRSVDGATSVALIEVWDGTAWSVQRSPGLAQPAGLLGVSCVNVDFCIAVGSQTFFVPRSLVRTLVEMWDGSRWSVVASPNPYYDSDSLNSVSCAATTSCVAVGTSSRGALAAVWKGTTWSAATLPAGGANDDALFGVSCPNAVRCFAVGRHEQSPLVLRWANSVWTAVPSAPLTSQALLFSVSCRNGCTAVGYVLSGASKTLVERWDGTSWTVQPSPNPSLASSVDANDLFGVSCVSAVRCNAVGAYELPDGSGARTLVESWDGTRWTVNPSGNVPDATGNYAQSVSCVNASMCFGVGTAVDTPTKNGVTLTIKRG